MGDCVDQDQFAIIQIAGLHSHTCEKAIQRSLLRNDGIKEVEVDFASGQASVLFDPRKITLETLTVSVAEAGYTPSNITVGQAGCGTSE